ncbi:MAG TPA: aminomethyl-transferring glycine dehydrogenase subunit GcvPA [Candidatus Eisenbacteria bacterium]|uniref:Probable glycine dehydrogenase (decarboxylating) subunit 1 n=1 Tax=Eiseniibacteriota bacterium TaxID=2212470 RepID=A0A7V2ATA3_UNCEI|nr:aminomethyl-transferring glycine dehydrogenase subunit GcvPA [Candidatus Eisenbacteria bacterium]
MSYVQNTDDDRKSMLKAVGASSIEELLEPIGRELRPRKPIDLEGPMSESEVSSLLESLAGRNRPATKLSSFLGGGIYDRHIPATVRYVLSRSEFYTSYTPYQAEVSQGTLQAIYEYQSLICRLTGMEVANASMYDGATALAEAILMAHGIKRGGRILVPRTIPPRAREVLGGYMSGRGIEIEEIPFGESGTIDPGRLEEMLSGGAAAVVMAQPNYFGLIEPAEEISKVVRGAKALLVSYVDPLSLALLTPPGGYGADIAVGEGQSLGNPQNFGGPLLGFMATRRDLMRRMPGRLISGTVDLDGKRGYVMTLQTREQHIRREKATSNICTNEGLCALAAAVYLSSLGESGFREAALQSMAKSHTLYGMLDGLPGFELPFGKNFFQEFVVRTKGSAGDFLAGARSRGILAGLELDRAFPELGGDAILVAVTEKRTRAELEAYRDLARGWR